jgi:ribosomal protein S18 acetylase RimI-like enzyme
VDTLSHDAVTRPATVEDAPLVHALYLATPAYFDVISIPIPTRDEVRTDLDTAARDPRRHTELVLLPPGDGSAEPGSEGLVDPLTSRSVAGYLDYKLNYPERDDATVNLLLIHAGMQSRGIGRRCVIDLEQRLQGRAGRVLASIYGQNPRAKRFWQSLGYHFAIDAKPILDWYAKELAET